MKFYDVSRPDKGKVARLQWDEDREVGVITYLRFDPPLAVEMRSRKFYDMVCEKLVSDEGATITEVTAESNPSTPPK